MKKKYLVYTILPVMAFALLGVGFASACGWGGFFGFGNIDPDKVAERQQTMKDYLRALVGKGVITQVQSDKRLEIMQNRFENSKMGKIGRGFGW